MKWKDRKLAKATAKKTTPAKSANSKKPAGKRPAYARNSHVENWDSGLGGLQDRGVGNVHAWWCSMNPFLRGANMGYMAQTAFSLYHGDWATNKVVSIPVDDMFREGMDFKYHGDDTDVDRRLEDECERLDLTRQLIRGKKLERLLGGAVGILIVRGFEGEKAEDPLTPDMVDKGGLTAIHIIGRNRVTRVEYEINPLSQYYNKPAHYWLEGMKIHRSRLLVFDGNPLSPHPERDFATTVGPQDGFGVSVLGPLWNALNRAELAQQGAAHLINMASVWFALHKGIKDLKANRQGNEALSEVRRMVETMSMYKGYVLDGDDVDVKQIAASFGSVPELVMEFLQVLSAGSDIPATRFLGQAPGGLNATGESDLENYYDTIRAKQKNEINPLLKRQLLPLLVNTTFGTGVIDPRDISIEWPGLWNMSDTEKAQMRATEAATIIALSNAELLPDDDAAKLLVQRDVLTDRPNYDDMERQRQELALFGGRVVTGGNTSEEEKGTDEHITANIAL